MTDKKSNDSRRKLLKSIAAGSGAVVAGKSLPESWTKPVIDTVMLPAHAETTEVETINYSKTMGFVYVGTDNNDIYDDQVLTFALGGLTPSGDGTVTISNLAGDLAEGSEEQWTINIGSISENTKNSAKDCGVAPGSVINVPLAVLQAAMSGGNITITAINGGDIDDFCTLGNDDGNGGTETNTTMDVTLAFPALA